MALIVRVCLQKFSLLGAWCFYFLISFDFSAEIEWNKEGPPCHLDVQFIDKPIFRCASIFFKIFTQLPNGANTSLCVLAS